MPLASVANSSSTVVLMSFGFSRASAFKRFSYRAPNSHQVISVDLDSLEAVGGVHLPLQPRVLVPQEHGLGGAVHETESNEMAFRMAAADAFRKALTEAREYANQWDTPTKYGGKPAP